MEENRRIEPGDATRGEIQILDETEAWADASARLLVARVRFPAKEHGRHPEGEEFRLAPGAEREDGVVVAPITADDRILLVRQFRHPVRMWLRELPRGSRARGERPAQTAARELREEIGYVVEQSYPLGRIANDSGQLSSLPFLYAARVRRAGERKPEPSEAIDRVFDYSFSELTRACWSGEILDSFTLAATLRLEPHFAGNRFAFRPEAAPERGVHPVAQCAT